MSVICAVVFADKVVTRMTVWSERMLIQDDKNTPARWVDSLDISRALTLACAAYESRTKRPPAERDIPIAGKTYRMPHILGLRYWSDGKHYDMSEGELVRTLIFGMTFSGPKTGDEEKSKP